MIGISEKRIVRFKRWFLEGMKRRRRAQKRHQYSWWKVMCLTGVDYFSTLGYQPGIAFLAAGALSPMATLVLVLVTLFGALPVYSRVAAESPNGEGSISMLEELLPRWRGKLFVLCLLGFAATDFIITITLSAADATAHIVENPLAPNWLHGRVAVTLLLIAALGGIFLKGFKEAIGLAVFLVWSYLLLNLLVIVIGLHEIAKRPAILSEWWDSLHRGHGASALGLIASSLLIFPKLALGLSGFETGVAVMPIVEGDPDDTPARPLGRIRNTRKLLRSAALIMSLMLISSSVVTTLLIPAQEFQQGGKAYGRALAFLAHQYLGGAFGTVYDLSTILILWFAGASAMAGLVNLVPRYLPRYGMAPEWARAVRPLVVIFTLIGFAITIIFDADVSAQAGAYATGVLVLMSSAAIAVTLSAWSSRLRWPFLLISMVFIYTTAANIIERPQGIKIAFFFIGSTILISLISRTIRATELRIERVELDDAAEGFIEEVSRGTIRIVANRRDRGNAREYQLKEKEKREDNHIPVGEPIIFFEVQPGDASQFSGVLKVRGVTVDGYRVLRTESPAVPNAIAAFLLYLRDRTGKLPHVYFGWTEGNPIAYAFKYIAFGEGDTAPLTREVLRRAEPDPERRPIVHVGG
jgi:hypothetical protein